MLIQFRISMGCWKALDQLAENYEVRLCWVPGHQGPSGNEKADAFAQKGAESPYIIGPEVVNEISKSIA